jgi:hypothetical protein
MHCRAIRCLAFALPLAAAVAASAACAPPVDLTKALEVTDVLVGYYDDGVQQTNMNDGRGPIPANKLRPSITFRLRNLSDRPLTSVQVMGSFWHVGADGEWDSILVNAISGDALPAGGTSAPITIRPNVAYNVEGPRATLFTDHRFQDTVAKLFAKRAGGLYRLGEYPIDRVILPHAGRPAPRP